jgi:hypothetical protein
VKKRRAGWSAAAISDSAFSTDFIWKCMFDWPEQSQTSPTTTSAILSSWFPPVVLG